MDIQRSLATLPLEILVEIVSYLPFEGRVAARSVCRQLNRAEHHQRALRLPEVAVYRTSPKELTLFAESNAEHSVGAWFACRSGADRVLNAWRRLDASNRDRELTTIAHRHLWCWEEASLGRVGGALRDLVRNARVGVLKLNQLTLTDEVNDALRSALSGASIDSIFASVNHQLSDVQSLDWLTDVATSGLTLYTRSIVSASFPFSAAFLLNAVRLPRVILHAKSERGTADTAPLITDSLLLSLLSSTCSCLRLRFNCPSLSTDGVLAAIQLLRSLPTTSGFTVYVRSEVAEELQREFSNNDGRGLTFANGDDKCDGQKERLVVNDLWMDNSHREIRYLHTASTDGQQHTIDDSDESFFRPIAK